MKQIFRRPSWNDPRTAVAILLFCYVVLGITLLGFNRSPAQILVVVISACILDVVLHRLFKKEWLFPFSALITGLSLSILVNYAHGSWLPLVPVFFAISSKYLLTFKQRHIYNPSLFGIVASLLFAEQMISISPAYQWGGLPALAVFIVTASVLLFVLRIQRTTLVIAFLGFYSLALLLRAWLTQHHMPAETIILGTLTAPSFYLFTFFMITDPATSPDSRKGQVLMAFVIVVIDLWLHTKETLSTLFYAAFIWYTLRLIWLHIRQIKTHNLSDIIGLQLIGNLKRLATITLFAVTGVFAHQVTNNWTGVEQPGFYLTKIPTAEAGIRSEPGDVLEKVDPRLRHVAKWLLSVGDAVAVADFDQDGLQDVFLSYPLKSSTDRAALYRNMGGFKFKRIALPALDNFTQSPEQYGLPSAALWFDYDNDSDQDLLVVVGYGYPILLQNQFSETGQADFIDISAEHDLQHFSISLTANVFDYDHDGFLDVLIGNAMNPWLPGYNSPTAFTIFDLPKPAYQGDRRMLNVMHRSWHNASNGGENLLLHNQNGKLTRQDTVPLGLAGTRWTLDIGTGDLNNDGWTDLYLANDFGPDDLYLNRQGKVFQNIKGKLRGSLGRDSYKGMNASLGDVDGNGDLDIYVSNVHEPLQAEGSMLWLNNGKADTQTVQAFHDAATQRNTLNPRRFGWGGAIGDMDRDGRLDILQANGMVDDSYDKTSDSCDDYWYWNAKVALTGPDIHGYADSWADLRGRCIFPREQNRVMLNQGRYFADVASNVGWQNKDNARGIALVDLDNDGDLDVLMTHQFAPVSIFRNDAQEKSWLGLKLEGDGLRCNQDAIGTRVEISYSHQGKDIQQIREVVASNGLSAQGDQRLLFGLDDYQGSVRIKIRWCGLTEQVLELLLGQYHYIQQENHGTE